MNAPVETFQSEKEFSRLLEIYRDLKPQSVLEIGSLYGGTLWHWMKNAQPGAAILSVDLPLPYDDERKLIQDAAIELWPRWAEQYSVIFQHLPLDSTKINTRSLVARLMPSVDFLFIDGDHHYNAVKNDYEVYSQLVRPGGIIAMHDIAITDATSPHYGVKPYWDYLRTQETTEAIIENPDWWGIGVVYR